MGHQPNNMNIIRKAAKAIRGFFANFVQRNAPVVRGTVFSTMETATLVTERPKGMPLMSFERPRVAQVVRDSPKIGRNEPCTCGSGQKFKKCHGA